MAWPCAANPVCCLQKHIHGMAATSLHSTRTQCRNRALPVDPAQCPLQMGHRHWLPWRAREPCPQTRHRCQHGQRSGSRQCSIGPAVSQSIVSVHKLNFDAICALRPFESPISQPNTSIICLVHCSVSMRKLEAGRDFFGIHAHQLDF